MLDIFLDSLLDSLKVFGIAFIINFILSFIEAKVSALFQRHKKISPLLGASAGLIPQCGISIVAADLYRKEHITIGTLVAVFFACSDEALPILFSDVEKLKFILPLIIIKFIFGFILGYLLDFCIKKHTIKEIEEEVHVGCCYHEIDSHDEGKIHNHFLHPFIHSFKIFCYVFVITFLFGVILFFIGENQIISFLKTNQYLGPIFAGLVGLVPNCASSVVLSELFLANGLSFGSLVTGLCVNSGLGIIYLLKYKDSRVKAFLIMLILLIYSMVLGYFIILIMNLL
ncbi:MAG: arsenic efflux protein [Anaeroplasmataceae bacterium]|nr:arsenic efflux protein [Anaeroplasmataceae bacterium]